MNRLKLKPGISKETYHKKMMTGMHLCTHLLFVDMYFHGQISSLIHDAITEAKELGIYKFEIKKRLNNIDAACKQLMIGFRACERVRVLPMLSYILESYVDDFREYGTMTQRLQYGLSILVKDKRFILWNCINNWVWKVDVFPKREKIFWEDVMMIDCLVSATDTFADEIDVILKKDVDQDARIDENLQYVHHLFGAMKKETSCMYNKCIECKDDIKEAKYWQSLAEQALVNLNTQLLSHEAIDLEGAQLYEFCKDYSMWWVAKVVSVMRQTKSGKVPEKVEKDLRRCIESKPLVIGRLKRTLASLAKKCKECDLFDLQDEIFEQHLTKDITFFVDRAIDRCFGPAEVVAIRERVTKIGQQKY